MKKQPNRDYVSNDIVMTPRDLAKRLYNGLSPSGLILEPARGDGAFYDLMPENSRDWCEIREDRDFLKYDKRVDWIITNPPWSLMRPFLVHSMKIADNVAFLCTLNHLWTRARMKDLYNNDFGIKSILLCDTPTDPTWPSTGFQLGMFHIQRNWQGDCSIIDLRVHPERIFDE